MIISRLIEPKGTPNKEAFMPATTTILITKGTIVSHRSNAAHGGIQSKNITLNCDVYVKATRHADGGWGYSVGKNAYYCCGGMALPL
jgi:hypothetical protein